MPDMTSITDPYKSRPVTTEAEIMARHYYTSRNTARSVGGRFTRSLLNMEPDDAPPDSLYWHKIASGSMEYLGDLLSPLGINKDVGEAIWPGETIQRFTWRTIYAMTEAAIIAWEEHGARSPEALADAAHRKLESLNNG